MTLLRRPLLGIALLAVAAVALMLPGAAMADPMGWVRTYAGPTDLPGARPGDAPIPVAGAFNAISFAGPTSGWAVGVREDGVGPQTGGTRYGYVAFTGDGGTTWTPFNVGSVEWNGVFVQSATNVWAVGAQGTVAHFDGASWTTTQIPGMSSYALRGVAFMDAGTGWAVGDGGAIAKYANGAWTLVTWPSITRKPLRAIACIDTSSCIAVGDGGTMYRLATAPVAVVSGTTANLYGVSFSDASHGWAVGDVPSGQASPGPRVARTGNGGATWGVASTLPMPAGVPAASSGARAVAFTDALTGVVVGKYQTVWRTLDGGDTWTAQRIMDSAYLGDVELRGVAFAPGTASASRSLITVARAYQLSLGPGDKAVAFRGSWTGMDTPTVRSNAVALYGDYASVTISAGARPGNGGLASITYQIDGAVPVTVPVSGETTSVTVPKITGARGHTLGFWTADAAGHGSAHQAVSFTIMARPSSAGYPTTPVVPGTIRHNVSFSSYGYVSYHPAGTAPVTLYVYRLRSGHYVLYKTVTCKVSTVAVAGSPFSKYAVTLKLPYTGTWRIRALHKTGSTARYSAYKTFTVR